MINILNKLNPTDTPEETKRYLTSRWPNQPGGTMVVYAMSLQEAQRTSEIVIPPTSLDTLAHDVLIARVVRSDVDVAPAGTYWLLDPQTPGVPISGQTRPFQPGYYLIPFKHKTWVDAALLAEVLP